MRTDQTSLCVPCRLRFAARERCPRCDGDGFDLRDAAQREAARAAILVAPPPPTRVPRWLIPRPGCVLAVVLVSIIVATFAGMALMLVLGLGAGGAMVLFFAVPIGATLLWVLVFGERWDRVMGRLAEIHGERPSAAPVIFPGAAVLPPIGLHRAEAPSPGAAGRVVVEGRVRLREPAVSPMAGEPCAAFRVVGTHGEGEVDDAGVVAFEVVDGDDATSIEGGAAVVELDTRRPSKARWTDALGAFLAERSLGTTADPLEVGESLLREGEPVRVEGVMVEMARGGDGYRSTRRVRVMEGRPGAPLVIRRGEA